MDHKVLVRLEVPSIRSEYEVLVPDRLRVGEVLPLFIKAVTEFSGGAYMTSNHEFLCAKTQNRLLDEDASLADCGVRTGDHLLLL